MTAPALFTAHLGDPESAPIGELGVGPAGALTLTEVVNAYRGALEDIVNYVNGLETLRIKAPVPGGEPGAITREEVARDDPRLTGAIVAFMEEEYRPLPRAYHRLTSRIADRGSCGLRSLVPGLSHIDRHHRRWLRARQPSRQQRPQLVERAGRELPDDRAAGSIGLSGSRNGSDGVDAPRRHRCAKVEVLMTPLEGGARVGG